MSDQEDIDIQAILARINSNLNAESDSPDKISTESKDHTLSINLNSNSEQSSELNLNESEAINTEAIKSQIFVVREEAESQPQAEDALQEHMKNISLLVTCNC